jgi:pimeloyl-ACP methyl ester carboxylesterase
MPTATADPSAGPALRALVARFDPSVLPPPPSPARVRLAVHGGEEAFDVYLDRRGATLLHADPGRRPDATITAPAATWRAVERDGSAGLEAFRTGRLHVRGNLHLGIGLLAATAEGSPLRFGEVDSPAGPLSTLAAGEGEPVLLLHGLGATKASFLPSVAALAAEGYRAIALDLPGFGDSAKPLLARYHPPFFARAITGALDAMGVERAHVVGNSMGGRVALELAFRAPERVGRLALLAPSLAWLRDRPWAWPLRLVRPELGLVQPAPRAVVERIVRRTVPMADEGWTAAGVDEFLRSYLTARGRAAFYTAARAIYLEDPERFWSRLETLDHDALFVWGHLDTLVPKAFARHVRRAAPHAQHLELSCGHVPQLERPAETHRAVSRFLREGRA